MRTDNRNQESSWIPGVFFCGLDGHNGLRRGMSSAQNLQFLILMERSNWHELGSKAAEVDQVADGMWWSISRTTRDILTFEHFEFNVPVKKS